MIVGPNQRKPHDLTIIPQTGAIMPGDHLTPRQAAQATHDWHHFGHDGHATTIEHVWHIAIIHHTNGATTLREADIPASGATTPTPPAQHPATNAYNYA